MEIKRLTERDQAHDAYPCMTEGPTPWAEGLPLSQQWFAANLGKHLEGFHLEEGRKTVGHIYWAPSERALVPYNIEDHVAFLYCYCEWVQRDYRGRGLMRQLFGRFIEELQDEGYKGVLVDGTEFEDYMHHSHFTKRGFRVLQDFGQFKLMYLPLAQEGVAVEKLEPQIPVEGRAPVPVEVLIIGSRFCPVGSAAVLLVRKVAEEFTNQVLFREVPASREAVARYGTADGIFINGKEKFMGPVSEEQVRRAIEEELG